MKQLSKGIQPNPIKVHLMPSNRCNHNCNFCLHKSVNAKNNEYFNSNDIIPLDKLNQILDDLKSINVKAIEISGGGEPLTYPHFIQMINKINKYSFDYSLISNGTLLTKELTKQIAPKMSWARISIDAGNAKTYSKIRGVPKYNFNRALNAITLLKKYAENPEFRIGIGFLVTNDNYLEIYNLCKIAKNIGANNVRIGLAFLKDGMCDKAIKLATEQVFKSKELETDTFKIYDLLDERITNISTQIRPYSFCPIKEISCVIGADCNVYTCCSLCYTNRGKIGSIVDKSFKELWLSKDKQRMFKMFNAKTICTIPCMYDQRNISINTIINGKNIHKNFI